MRLGDARLDVQWLRCRAENPYPVPLVAGTAQAFRREVLEVVGSFDDGFRQRGAEDVELCLRMWLLGYEVWVVPEVEVAHLYRPASPYSVDWAVVLANMLRVGLLHVGGERLARFLHAWKDDRRFARAMAICAESDVGRRRAELLARRHYDDDWFFSHPYFREMHAGL
jgi:cellulose synthase/poly-beta-1,6-N-acetylglucosamine synthase-like glycosyltransferase